MTKTTKVILSIVSIVVVFTTFIVLYINIFGKKDYKFELKTHYLELKIGESKNLKDLYTVTNAKNVSILCFVNDITFAEITEDSIITGKSVGETKILFKCGNNVNFEKDYINLSVVEAPVIPTDFSFNKTEITLSLNTEFVINNLICNENYNVTPVITYSVNNICEYNVATNKITPISLGTTIVYVTFSTEESSITRSFTVNVKNNYRNLTINLTKENNFYILYMTQNVVANFEILIYENSILQTGIKLNYEFLDENSVHASFIQYESNIFMLKATNEGETFLKVYCEDDPSVFELIKLKVD
ncbi:MAG: hypothetical protein E7359_00090 [Clostridiales bacterium]|nr:hypothetical protein [Clostridiales bacterium]